MRLVRGHARDTETHLASLLPSARTTLGAEVPAAVWAEGQALSLDEVVALALEDSHAAPHRP